jgi:chromosome segregation and condensation protein ScpB
VSAAGRVPFGQESRAEVELGLKPAPLAVVVAVVAADFCQVGPVSAADLEQVVDCSVTSYMARLERAGWVEVAGRLPRSTTKLYRSTARARRLLGLEGWSLLKEVA